MKQKMIPVLIGAIIAIGGILGAYYVSAMPFLGIDKVSEGMQLLGHVTYELRGSDGTIKQYLQTDNIIVDKGKDCATQILFRNDDTLLCTFPAIAAGENGFNHVAIGNDTTTAEDPTINALPSGTGPGVTGEVARIHDGQPTLTAAASPAGAQAQISAQFTIDETIGSTTITNSGLFNGNSTAPGDMFSAQNLPGGGVAVNSTDTLTVTWTVTVG